VSFHEKVHLAKTLLPILAVVLVVLLVVVVVLAYRLRETRREAAWSRRLLKAHERIDRRTCDTVDAIRRVAR
jgi:hypothetical protein